MALDVGSGHLLPMLLDYGADPNLAVVVKHKLSRRGYSCDLSLCGPRCTHVCRHTHTHTHTHNSLHDIMCRSALPPSWHRQRRKQLMCWSHMTHIWTPKIGCVHVLNKTLKADIGDSMIPLQSINTIHTLIHIDWYSSGA